MRIKAIVEEDFINYKQPSMFIGTCKCDWKCAKDGGFDVSICQNSLLAQSEEINMSYEEIYRRYIKNPITNSIVIGGLEPFLQFDDIYNLINYFRINNCEDIFVIYTGYYKEEIQDKLSKLKSLGNIIVKFGRFLNNSTPIFDKTLGVTLATNNQWGERIS